MANLSTDNINQVHQENGLSHTRNGNLRHPVIVVDIRNKTSLAL